MPITFTEGLTPSFPPNSFDSELQHVKLLYTEVEAGTGHVNPLEPEVTNLINKIKSRKTELTNAKASIDADIVTLQGYTVVPVDEFGVPLTDEFGNPITNLPTCWPQTPNAFGISDINTIIAALQGLSGTLDTTINTTLEQLRNELETVDIDNFKLHMELLSGVDDAPPPGIIKPNNPALMGLVRAVTDIENRFGITFTNYLVLVFETLFLADVTVANAQTSVDAEPLTGTYPSVITRVNACPTEANAPTNIVNDITAYAAPLVAWNTDVATHKPIFEQHITDDTAEYDALTDKLARYVQAYQISQYIQDPYYAFMYTDVFGSNSVIAIANQLANGEIT